MAIVRWDPFGELADMQSRLNRLFTVQPSAHPEGEAFLADWSPAVDLQETEGEYLIKADLPEVKKEDVKVTVQDNVVTVAGDRRQEKEEKGKKFHRIERAYGHFERRFALPTDVDTPKVHAEYKDGVLNVTLPKTAKALPKSVDVKVA
jgi:HSP20 family protein